MVRLQDNRVYGARWRGPPHRSVMLALTASMIHVRRPYWRCYYANTQVKPAPADTCSLAELLTPFANPGHYLRNRLF
jgi:hypothetical protein